MLYALVIYLGLPFSFKEILTMSTVNIMFLLPRNTNLPFWCMFQGQLLRFLRMLKEKGKKLFLLTNSPYYFVDGGMRFMLEVVYIAETPMPSHFLVLGHLNGQFICLISYKSFTFLSQFLKQFAIHPSFL